MHMQKSYILKDGQTNEEDKIVLGGDTTVITGEIIVDEHNDVLEFKHE